jgi:putative SOS response-associated peptidase YedK
MINARVETVSSKPSFRDAFKKRRCLIPADGFYEWSGTKGDKQPFFITWLDYDNHDTKRLQEILDEKTVIEFKIRPVSNQVNSVKINEPSSIAPILK